MPTFNQVWLRYGTMEGVLEDHDIVPTVNQVWLRYGTMERVLDEVLQSNIIDVC